MYFRSGSISFPTKIFMSKTVNGFCFSRELIGTEKTSDQKTKQRFENSLYGQNLTKNLAL